MEQMKESEQRCSLDTTELIEAIVMGGPKYYKLSDKAFNAFNNENLPKIVLEKLDPLKNKEISSTLSHCKCIESFVWHLMSCIIMA